MDSFENVLLASPLYILRDECGKDLPEVLARLADAGFQGVEFLGFFGESAGAVHDRMEELKLTPVGNHVPYTELAADTVGVIDFHAKAGCRYLTVGGIPEEGLPGGRDFAGTVKQLTRIGKACRESGITLLYHNHAFELARKVQGRYMLEVILDETPGDCLSLEPDLGWMAIGGADPAYFLDRYRTRCPVIHLKDFYASDISRIGDAAGLGARRGTEENAFFEFRPVGYGIANIPQYINQVLACGPEWLVMDHDLAYERDSYEDLRLSLEYVRRLLSLL